MISPIMANGITMQTQNVGLINNGDENRGQINYQNTQVTVEEQREQEHSTVIASQDSSKADTNHDAREEGRNKYYNNRKTVKKSEDDEFGKVVKKQSGSGFNITV